MSKCQPRKPRRRRTSAENATTRVPFPEKKITPPSRRRVRVLRLGVSGKSSESRDDRLETGAPAARISIREPGETNLFEGRNVCCPHHREGDGNGSVALLQPTVPPAVALGVVRSADPFVSCPNFWRTRRWDVTWALQIILGGGGGGGGGVDAPVTLRFQFGGNLQELNTTFLYLVQWGYEKSSYEHKAVKATFIKSCLIIIKRWIFLKDVPNMKK